MQKPGNNYSEKNDQRVFEIIIRDRAFKQLESIPKKFVKKLDNLILSLANNPYPHGVKKLQGYENVYRVRYADYRVVYAVYNKKLVIEIIQLGNRKDIYNKL